MRGKAALTAGIILGAGFLLAVAILPHDATGIACFAAIASSSAVVFLEDGRRRKKSCASSRTS
ncbi:MAG: hypothetical protein K2Y21_10125 [Phycisphaerales bacterium]|nr:hypothetical protein [Phycisphaerales bacterium]